jgi:hypothetical protein
MIEIKMLHSYVVTKREVRLPLLTVQPCVR